MIHIISILKSNDITIESYLGLETRSDSVINLKPELLKYIIENTDIQAVNASIRKGSIIVKSWVNGISTVIGEGMNSIRSGPKYILLAAKENDMYKVVDHYGEIYTIDGGDLRNIAKSRNIANCSTKMETLDTYNIKIDKEFITGIESKYEIFMAKTTMLGHKNIMFNYDIENHEVRLTKYTGSNKDVILPNFITSIKEYAFSRANIRTIKLNEGLKVIGTRAFATKEMSRELERIEIPATVELICNKAFISHGKLVKRDGTMNADRFNMRNDKTIVLEQALY